MLEGKDRQDRSESVPIKTHLAKEVWKKWAYLASIFSSVWTIDDILTT
jgi:hypothetical protein